MRLSDQPPCQFGAAGSLTKAGSRLVEDEDAREGHKDASDGQTPETVDQSGVPLDVLNLPLLSSGDAFPQGSTYDRICRITQAQLIDRLLDNERHGVVRQRRR